jgi:capsular polysaccharide biosynthesis protein
VKKSLVGAITASLLIAAVVVMFSATRTPTYEASAKVLVEDQKEQSYGKIHPIPNAPTHERVRQLIQTMTIVIDTHPVAEEVIRRLGLEVSPDQLLNNLSIEQIESSQFIQLSYTDTDPARSAQVVNTVGEVSSERISPMSAAGSNFTANVWEKAAVPESPASPKPLRNGLIALVGALALSAALIEARRRGHLYRGRER